MGRAYAIAMPSPRRTICSENLRLNYSDYGEILPNNKACGFFFFPTVSSEDSLQTPPSHLPTTGPQSQHSMGLCILSYY